MELHQKVLEHAAQIWEFHEITSEVLEQAAQIWDFHIGTSESAGTGCPDMAFSWAYIRKCLNRLPRNRTFVELHQKVQEQTAQI
ncbi:hypothetical protein DPMN_178316 [Dreissena polymorpha]|uniref:Uncharacterized protein n=1 Tax=Dreissena polymorpha TaxID=45954 RepID=A0A9D4EEZ0_DREPO|nr:hypothetical protein DPMN_178316 [Dreissena polymorpha]